MAPADSTRTGPKRSAMAPANGCAAPHSRFCSAIANEKVSRPQPRSNDMGDRNWPSAERGPNASSAIAQPHAIKTIGVRHGASFNGADASIDDMREAPEYQRWNRRAVETLT